MEKKLVDTVAFKTAVDKIKSDFPTKTAVADQIQEAALGGSVSFATEEEILAMFEDAPDAPNT